MAVFSRADHDESFTRFVAEASPSLTRTAWLLTGNRDAAAELVQSALVKTYVAWRRVRRDEALSYARRILINANVDQFRRRHGEVLLPNAEPQPAASEFDRVDVRESLVKMLAALPRQQRTVVVLRYLEDLSEVAVAEQLGISVGTVKSAASRGSPPYAPPTPPPKGHCDDHRL